MLPDTRKVAFTITVVAIGYGTALAQPGERPTSPTVINIALGHAGEAKSAAVWVSNGLRFDRLSPVVDAVRNYGHSKIYLYVEGGCQDLNPDDANGDQDVGIRLTSDHAEVFVREGVSYPFTEMLCKTLSQFDGIREVRVRRLGSAQVTQETTGPAPGWDKDPFTSAAAASDAFPTDDDNPFEN
jgi:hypothetical protein